MKNVVLFLSALILGTSGALATATASSEDKVSERLSYRYNDSFIFVEDGITFSVYPDGEFDFYIEDYITGRRNGVTFNSGYDYSPYAQYDDYGAVIQVENIPIFYDHYGRVTQIGNVDIDYRRNRVRRVGGMNVYYNRRGFYDYHTGYINVYNRFYVYRPWHAFFARPTIGLCLVYNRPYRRFYNPIRYTYYSPYRYNTRRAYAKIGRTHRYNEVRQERARIYRNDRRVAVRDNAVRSNRSVSKRSTYASRGNGAARSNRSIAPRSTATTRSNSAARRNASARTDQGRTVNRSNTVRSNGNRTSSNRKAASRTGTSRIQRSATMRSPKRSTVTRSTKSYKSPQRSSSNRSVRQAPSRNRNNVATRSSSSRNVNKAPSRSRSSVSKRSTPSRSTAGRTPSRSRSSVSKRSSSSRSTVSRAPSRSSRSGATRSSSSRSSRRY